MSNVFFDGPCPFLTCLKTEPHTHPICPTCGAMRWGNPFQCTTCRSHIAERRQEMTETLAALDVHGGER